MKFDLDHIVEKSRNFAIGCKDFVKEYPATVKREAPASTTIIIAFTPISALVEKLSSMTDISSYISRLGTIPITYLEIPLLLLGRKYYHMYIAKTNDDSTQKHRENHDKIYGAATTAIISPLFYYYVSNVQDWVMIAGATAGGLILAATIIKPLLYVMDVAKDLMGIETLQKARKDHRKPKEFSKIVYIRKAQQYTKDKTLKFENWLETKSQRAKRTGLALLVAGSIAATAAVYMATPNNNNNRPENPGVIYTTIEKILQ